MSIVCEKNSPDTLGRLDCSCLPQSMPGFRTQRHSNTPTNRLDGQSMIQQQSQRLHRFVPRHRRASGCAPATVPNEAAPPAYPTYSDCRTDARERSCAPGHVDTGKREYSDPRRPMSGNARSRNSWHHRACADLPPLSEVIALTTQTGTLRGHPPLQELTYSCDSP